MSDTHAHSVAFVRETSLPPAPPPAAETGIVKWLRENLFATPANGKVVIKQTLPAILEVSPRSEDSVKGMSGLNR